MRRKTSGRFFGKDELAIFAHLKDATAGRNQFYFYGKFFFDLCGQTDRLGIIVSLRTVFDGNFHALPPKIRVR